MDLYFKRHDGEAATVEQFIQCFADVSGRDFSQFMRWYSQAGTPEVTVVTRHDVSRKTFTHRMHPAHRSPTPGQPEKLPMVIPLGLGLLGSDGHELPLSGAAEHGIVVLTGPSHTFEFTGIAERPVAVDQPQFLGADQAHDRPHRRRSRFPRGPRQRSVQPLAVACRPCRQSCSSTMSRLSVPAKHRAATTRCSMRSKRFSPTASSSRLSSRWRSTPPGEGDIAREIGRDIDPDAIHAARKALRAGMGERLAAALAQTYERMTIPGPYSPDAQAPAAAACATSASICWPRPARPTLSPAPRGNMTLPTT